LRSFKRWATDYTKLHVSNVRTMATPPLTKRLPQQSRSRESWERALQVGMELFEERGWDGLTIAEVCKRASISPPSLYARVAGKAEFFVAVHERWLARIIQTEEELVAQHVQPGTSDDDTIEVAVRVIAGIFSANEQAFRAVIARSTQDPDLLQRGSVASQALLERLVATIFDGAENTHVALRAVYAECLLRTTYGADFLSASHEDQGDFEHRLVQLARRIILGSDCQDGR